MNGKKGKKKRYKYKRKENVIDLNMNVRDDSSPFFLECESEETQKNEQIFVCFKEKRFGRSITNHFPFNKTKQQPL